MTEVDSNIGYLCLQKEWSNTSSHGEAIESCGAAWDSVYCWPPTQPGIVVKRSCSEVFEQSYSQYSSYLQGYVTRECLGNGSWADGNDSNYDDCADSFQQYLSGIEEDNLLILVVHYMLFFGSIMSLICLATSLAVFQHFRCLRCERVTIHVNLMLSLVLRFFLLMIISEPFVIGHRSTYRDMDILCKTILVLFLYSTFSSISWMFVEGLFLNIALMADVVTISTHHQLTVYNIFGWGVPAGFIAIFVLFIDLQNQESCWEGYSDMAEMWVLVGPISFELVVNGIFLLNILRILLRKIRRSNTQPDSSQLKAAAKATVILFPVLGLNNLILLYNPGGDYNKFFVLLTTFFNSTHGIFVSIVFCFADKEVLAAIRRSIDRAKARRTVVGSNRSGRSIPQLSISLTEMMIRPKNLPIDNMNRQESV